MFDCGNFENFSFAIEICEDLWVPNPPSTSHALSRSHMLYANLSASDETTGKDDLQKPVSGKWSVGKEHLSAYIYADAGDGESYYGLGFCGAQHHSGKRNHGSHSQSVLKVSTITYGDIDLR